MNYTKAKMLSFLKRNLNTINIMPLCIVNSQEYFAKKDETVDFVLHKLQYKELIVRSSSAQEDMKEESNAGKYMTLLGIQPNRNSLQEAIEKVYNSYNTIQNEEILIQPMIINVVKSGVVFTQDIETYADYYIVNYHLGNDTTAVTSGITNSLKTFVSYKEATDKIEDSDMKKLIENCKEIEVFLKNEALDIEFAIDDTHSVYILQVRPIACGNKPSYQRKDLSIPLNRIYLKVEKLSKPHPFLLGERTCFGVMPDWNPAEILGVRPKKLSISLYKELITDCIWAHQRKNYGYRDMTMHPLMISFCGIPYIDTRITFNSFLPEKLNAKIAEKLTNYYLDRLAEYPAYHDKIEFEIVFSCYYFGINDKLKKLQKYGFNKNEIKRVEFSLLELTNQIIHPQNGLYKKDIEKITVFEKNYNKIILSDISLVDKIYWLLEECKTYGTLPFAGVARAAFVAIQFLHSFVEMEYFTQKDYDEYFNSLNTISKKISIDYNRYCNNEISKDEFVSLYGHIRPGTYDILSKRYDDDFDEYFGERHVESVHTKELFKISEEMIQKIQLELEQNGLDVSAEELFTFIKESIEGREYLKYVFTKAVSEILKLIELLGKRTDIPIEDLAHLDITLIKQLYSDLYFGDIASMLKENIENNKRQYEYARQIKLPSVIVNPKDVYNYYLLDEEPNFITQRKVIAEVVSDPVGNVEGRIVFIQSADPGYDFLFSKNIAGLITQFGGANSHMAIRCAELGIPAVIGAGERNYSEWKRCNKIEINCIRKQVICIF